MHLLYITFLRCFLKKKISFEQVNDVDHRHCLQVKSMYCGKSLFFSLGLPLLLLQCTFELNEVLLQRPRLTKNPKLLVCTPICQIIFNSLGHVLIPFLMLGSTLSHMQAH
ncbi:cytochrome c oxidase subunit 5A, mitochondrial [Platysternon megacephalum]|uniref:Cytochrome c oxidase subunit 5A, mitochondrial n=1 Tax=Platysternon megacephalum TaxID=55544 RepID=A0A4D9ELI0_9SAUR|nr:cytochrome c oxidase subunit 5A, mitochondrial [Platysternon megacephalum]